MKNQNAFTLSKYKGSNVAGQLFIIKLWKNQRRSTQENIKRTMMLIIGIPIVLVGVIEVELLSANAPTAKQSIIENNHSKNTAEILTLNQPSTESSLAKCPKLLSTSSVYCLLTESKLLPLFETFAIAIALIIYILEGGDRRESRSREDWTLIDSARGSETSGARVSAILRLYEEKESLRGLDAPGADLRSIRLEGADLEYADFREAKLNNALLSRAKLNGANLQDIILEEADMQFIQLEDSDLRGANLKKVNMQGALLGGAKLHRVNLRGSNLVKSDLRGARFCSTSLRGADLYGAQLQETTFERIDFSDVRISNCNIEGTRFKECKNLSIEQVKTTINWQLAYFDAFTLSECHDLRRLGNENTYTKENDQDDSFEILKTIDDINTIEDLIDKIRSRNVRSLDDPHFTQKMKELYLSDFKDLKDSINQLEDLEIEKRKELEDLIQDVRTHIKDES
jgi:BTB/POZ domain-containing protein KCTD9